MKNKVPNPPDEPLNHSALEPLKDGWKWVRLGEVCSVEKGKTPNEFQYADKGIRIIKYRDINAAGKINWKSGFRSYVSLEFKNLLKPLHSKTTLIGADAHEPSSIGKKVAYVDSIPPDIQECYYSGELIAIEILDEGIIHPLLPYLWFKSYEGYKMIQNFVEGVHLNKNSASQMLIPLPPIDEQRRIVEKLNKIMSEIEKARSACEKQLETVKALPSVYLREVFESEEAKRWERQRLGEVCEIFSGSSAPQDKKYFENGKYPFVRVQDLGRYGKTDNLTEIKDFVNDLAIEQFNLVKATKGTIIFPKSGAAITTNNRAILGIDAYVVSHLAALKPKEKFADIYFIYFWLCNTDMVQYMENLGYPSLKLSTISKISILLPPLKEQQRIANYLKEKMTEVGKLRQSIEKQLSAINALPQAYLKKAFRGEL